MAMQNRLLTKSEIDSILRDHQNWCYKKSFVREINFKSYTESISFINKIAKEAEKINHHPDMEVGWCNIKIYFSTHDLNGVSLLDQKMVKITDKIIG